VCHAGGSIWCHTAIAVSATDARHLIVGNRLVLPCTQLPPPPHSCGMEWRRLDLLSEALHHGLLIISEATRMLL